MERESLFENSLSVEQATGLLRRATSPLEVWKPDIAGLSFPAVWRCFALLHFREM